MTKSRKLLIAAALTFVGAAVSVYQTNHYYQLRSGMGGLKSFCQVGSFDCVAIETSRYAELIAGIPLSGLAAGWLFAQFALLLMALVSNSRAAARFAFFQSIVSLGASAVYLGIMAVVIKSWCILCLSLDLINAVNFAILFSAQKQNGIPVSNDTPLWKHAVGAGLGSLAIMWFLSRSMNPLVDVTPTQMNEYIDSIMLTKPVAVSYTKDEVISGPENAPITIIKFSDFECPACKMGAQAVHPILSEYHDKIKFVFKNHPLDQACNRKITRPLHQRACELARIGLCAQSRGLMEKVYETFFDNQKLVSKVGTDIFAVLTSHGVNDSSLKACAASAETAGRLNKQIEEGIALGIGSTPTFYVNGILITGGLPAPAWKILVERLLKK
ncbi:MAG: thioredoxin domain-containing protein [Xanthomonadaceae bacterium]|nr:thioredoxin domain-containing protein [Xanthomonadaceae bacterium]